MSVESLKKSASDRLRELRESKKAQAKNEGGDWRQWTQAKIASAVGVDTVTYQRWEAGTAWPETGPRLHKLAQVLGVSPGFFLDSNSEPTPKDQTTLSDLARMDARIIELLEQRQKEVTDLEVARLKAKVASIPEEIFECWPRAHEGIKAICLHLLTGNPDFVAYLSDESLKLLQSFLRSFRTGTFEPRS